MLRQNSFELSFVFCVKTMLLKKTFEFARRPTERFYVTGLGIAKLVFLGLGARNVKCIKSRKNTEK